MNGGRDLLDYFQRELEYLRLLGGRFADEHPKIAGRLRLSKDTVEDPHVARLFESVAFLNARTRRKLDDELPELVQGLLSILDPHFLAPMPSLSVVQFTGLPDASAVQRLPRGTLLETDRAYEQAERESCTFRTVYPVELWPFEIAQARLLHTPFTAPPTHHSTRCPAALQLRLRTYSGAPPFSALQPGFLRFQLWTGGTHDVAALYELLRTSVLEIAVATSERDRKPVVLPAAALVPIGFSPDESILPYASRASHGQRLLAEALTFAEKFTFFELGPLPPEKLAECAQQLDLYLYLERPAFQLESVVAPSVFALGTTPIVNLFEGRAAPIELEASQFEYRVVPDPRRPRALEVHSVQQVQISNPGAESFPCHPFYSIDHRQTGSELRPWWHTVRRSARELVDTDDGGSEVFLRFVDVDGRRRTPEGALAIPERCLFTNRDLPAKLPFGGEHPRMALVEGAAIKSVRCLRAPTPVIRPRLDGEAMWRALAHLSLDHLSLVDGEQATTALREMLRHLDFQDSPETRNLIEGIAKVDSRPAVMRVHSGGLPGIVRGLDVRVFLDERRYVGTSPLLFAGVLERFFGTHCGVNSFVRTALWSKELDREVHRWPPRAGDRTLL